MNRFYVIVIYFVISLIKAFVLLILLYALLFNNSLLLSSVSQLNKPNRIFIFAPIVLIFLELFIYQKFLKRKFINSVRNMTISTALSTILVAGFLRSMDEIHSLKMSAIRQEIAREETSFLKRHKDTRLQNIKYTIGPNVSKLFATLHVTEPGKYQIYYNLTDKYKNTLAEGYIDVDQNDSQSIELIDESINPSALFVKHATQNGGTVQFWRSQDLIKEAYITYSIFKIEQNKQRVVYKTPHVEKLLVIDAL